MTGIYKVRGFIMKVKEKLIGLLEECQPFLVHAICSIPESNPECLAARILLEKIEPLIFLDVKKALAKNLKNFKAGKFNVKK